MENIFIILLGLTMIYISSTSRLKAHVKMLALQGWCLFFICLIGISHQGWFTSSEITSDFVHLGAIALVVAETILVKSFVIPFILNKVLDKTKAQRDTDANIPHFYSLVISSFILFLGFLTPAIQSAAFKLISPLYFGISISIIIISLWLITIKHTVLSNVISFITMENGIFLLSLAFAAEMPVIVSLGVLLDIFIAVFILGVLIKEINNKFDDLEISQLSELKDYEQ